MTGLDIFTFVVMLVLLVAAGVFIKILGALPGKIARSRAHPQAEAINVCGWLGILTLGLAWPVALIWAYTRSPSAPQETKNTRALEQTIAELSQRLSVAEQRLHDTTARGDKGA